MSAIAPPKPIRATGWQAAGSGLVLGVLTAIGLLQLIGQAIPILGTDWLMPFGAAVGALLGRARGRRALWITAGVTVAALAVVGYTPLASVLIHRVIRSDPLKPAPAVVVLASALQKDGELNNTSQGRLIQGYELVRRHYAPRLVLTRLAWRPYSYLPPVRDQLQQLGLAFPVEEVGPVINTHDEAVAVARLARERGWSHILLVSQPWHLRRAGALFEKLGLTVTCSPCVEGEYDLSDLDGPGARFRAFRDWLHEAIGFQVYRWRGWV